MSFFTADSKKSHTFYFFRKIFAPRPRKSIGLRARCIEFIFLDGPFISKILIPRVTISMGHPVYTVIQIVAAAATCCCKGSFKNYVDKIRGIGGQKCHLLATFRMKNVHVVVGRCPKREKRAKLGQRC